MSQPIARVAGSKGMLLIVVSLFLLYSTPVFCETFISGSVSGEWKTAGSPYYVTDSTWVNEGKELKIRPGVEIFFGTNVGMWVFGRIVAIGAEKDTIRFSSCFDDSTWRGISLAGVSQQHEFDYCVYTGALEGITLYNNILLSIRHSIITGKSKALGGRTVGGSTSCRGSRITVENSTLLGNPVILNVVSSALNITNSTVHRQIIAIESGLNAENCVFYDGIDVRYSNYINCRFLFSGDSTSSPYVNLGGILKNCYAERTIYLDYIPSKITHLQSTKAVFGTADLEMDSSVIDFFNVNGFEAGIAVRNCTITNGFDASSDGKIDLFKCRIWGNSRLWGNGPITADSCEFNSLYPNGDEYEQLEINTNFAHSSTVSITRSLVTLSIDLCRMDMILLLNNTFCFYKPYGRPIAIENSANNTSSIIQNNIFLCESQGTTFYKGFSAVPPVFNNNTIYGFSRLYWDQYSTFDMDSTNLFLNPLFVSVDSADFNLLADSPCIDAGDPDSPLDPDGTRADIGAYYFPHKVSVRGEYVIPPISISLISSYPNPFNSSTRIAYDLPIGGMVSLTVYDLSGREVAQLADGVQPAGRHSVIWQAEGMATGVYLVRLTMGETTVVSKALLIR